MTSIDFFSSFYVAKQYSSLLGERIQSYRFQPQGGEEEIESQGGEEEIESRDQLQKEDEVVCFHKK